MRVVRDKSCCFAALLASLLLAGVASSHAAELLASLPLRPAMSATSYIQVVPDEPFAESFGRLIRQSIQHADTVQAAAARWQAERAGVEVAAAAQLPSALLYGEAGLAAGRTGSAPYAYGVRVSLPLFDGHSAGYATEAQMAMSGAARYAAMDELAATLVDLVAAAAAIKRSDAILEIRRVQLLTMEDLLAAIVSERETGTASKVDTDQVEAQLAQIEIEVRVAETARSQAKESFARIAGEAPHFIASIGSIAALLPTNARTATTVALAENPQLAQRLELASAARLTRDSTEAGFGPDLSLDFDAGGAGDFASGGSPALDARAVFRLEVPFSFGTEAAVQQRALQAQAADFEVSAARTGVTAGLASAYERLDDTRGSLSLAYDALDRARQVRSGMQTERELGERTIFDLLTAQNAYAEAQIRVAGLRYEITVAEHLLAAQIGRLDDIYGVTLADLH